MACKRSAVRSRLAPPNSLSLMSWYYDEVPRYGGIAQLGERLHGMQEVSGSIPLISTTLFSFPCFDSLKKFIRLVK